MSDWLDSDEFESLVDDVVAAECSYDSFEALQAKIREHFEPKRKWIKITDNPKTWPPLGVRVLLDSYGSRHIGQRESGDYGLNINRFYYYYYIEKGDCHAWMPLPEPLGEE